MNTYGHGWLIASKGGTFGEAQKAGPLAVEGFDGQVLYANKRQESINASKHTPKPIVKVIDDWSGSISGGTD
jgi:hypothetical protein